MRTLLLVAKIGAACYLVICALLYFFQEKLIFFPEKLPADYTFSFDTPSEEIFFTTPDHNRLSTLFFKASNPKGLIFYLHGNAGSLRSWGAVAGTYTKLQYDVCMLDYRGYGKSSGRPHGEQAWYNDVQLVYDSLKQHYAEQQMVVLGYSIGTGAATWLAAVNHPALLILQAPYFSLTDLVKTTVPFIPSFILRYPFRIDQNIQKCRMPVIIFHGDQDEVIGYNASVRLQKFFKPVDRLVTLTGQGHNNITDNCLYQAALKKALDSAVSRP